MRARICLWLALALLIYLCPTIAATKCHEESCTFKKENATLRAGQTETSKEIKGMYGSELAFDVKVSTCSNATIGCYLWVFIATGDQMSKLLNATATSGGNGDKISRELSFLERGVNYFPNITASQSASVYFQKYETTDVRLLFLLDNRTAEKQNTTGSSVVAASIDYKVAYTHEACIEYAVGGFLLYVCGMIVIAAACTAVAVLSKKSEKRLLHNALKIEARERKLQHRYYKDRQLRSQKTDSGWWLCRPAINACKCAFLPFAERPKYTFIYEWVFSHDWLSLVYPSPSEEMRRYNKVLLTCTKLTLSVFVLTAWATPILETVHDSASLAGRHLGGDDDLEAVAPRDYREMLTEIGTKAVVAWLAQELLGTVLLYPRVVLWSQSKGALKNEISIGGSAYELSDPSDFPPLWKRAGAFLLSHLPAFVLCALALAVAAAAGFQRDAVTCENLARIVVQVVFVEAVFKSVFPGLPLAWLKYAALNTCGKQPPPPRSPFGASYVSSGRELGALEEFERD